MQEPSIEEAEMAERVLDRRNETARPTGLRALRRTEVGVPPGLTALPEVPSHPLDAATALLARLQFPARTEDGR